MRHIIKHSYRLAQKGSSGYRNIIHFLGHLFFDRNSLVFIGLLILTVAADVVKDLYWAVLSPEDDVEEMMREIEGISSLFLGIGLILKERRILRLIFGLCPAHDSPIEDSRDRLCLHMGLCLLLNGTGLRLSAQLIRVPNRIIPTEGLESLIFTVGLIFCLIASTILLYLIFQLIFSKKTLQPT